MDAPDMPALSKPCLYCGEPVPPSRYRGRAKNFCKAAHRAAYFARRRQQAIEASILALDLADDGLQAAGNQIEACRATIRAQRDALVQLRQKPRKEAPKPVDTTG